MTSKTIKLHILLILALVIVEVLIWFLLGWSSESLPESTPLLIGCIVISLAYFLIFVGRLLFYKLTTVYSFFWTAISFIVNLFICLNIENVFKNRFQKEILIYTLNYAAIASIVELVCFLATKLMFDFVYKLVGISQIKKMRIEKLLEKH